MRLSPRQRQVFRFFSGPSHMLIADGSIRSGKTFSLLHGFLLWSLGQGRGLDFGIAGRTIGAIRRNIVQPYVLALGRDPAVRALGGVRLYRSDNAFCFGGNRFICYGGDKESSQYLIQGKTLSGLLIDEAATLRRSFLDQAVARCSASAAKVVMSCNPGNPGHFFYRDYISRARELGAVYLRFRMDDNPALGEAVKARYRRLYSGVFYERYVLGRWTAAEGAVFPAFAADPSPWLLEGPAPEYARLYIGVDFGGSRAKTVFVLAGVVEAGASGAATRDGASGPAGGARGTATGDGASDGAGHVHGASTREGACKTADSARGTATQNGVGVADPGAGAAARMGAHADPDTCARARANAGANPDPGALFDTGAGSGGPEIHILESRAVADGGQSVDAERIVREYAAFFEHARRRYGRDPVMTCTDHLEMLRLGMRKAVAEYRQRVVFADKGAIRLREWVALLGALFRQRRLRIAPGNELVVEAFRTLLFDPAAGDDRPLDDGRTCDVDTYDATRYALVETVKDWTRRGLIQAL